MAWTTEDRHRYAPAIQEMVRQGMLARLATTIDAIDPPSPVGRPSGSRPARSGASRAASVARSTSLSGQRM